LSGVQPAASPDLIAATALGHDLPIYTRNPDDFVHLDGVRIVEVGTT
jgi:predicted nucleic acid-binding protein